MLNKDQESYINLLRDQRIRDYLLKHPEFSSGMMSGIANIISDEGFNDNIIHPFIDFCRAFGTRGADENEPDKIGGWDVTQAFFAIKDNMSDSNVAFAIEYAKNHPEASIDKILYETISVNNFSSLFAEHVTKRVKLITDSETLMLAQMSEGNPDAKKILKLLMYSAHEIDQKSSLEWQKTQQIGSHLMVGFMDILSLDDMNIRGDQIVYAFEYCGKDIKTFEKFVSSRNKQMVDYVNQEMTEHSDSSIIPEAVYGQASFKDVPPVKFTIGKEMTSNINPFEVSYLTREIYSKTPYDEAKKILEANGFETVFERPIDVKNKGAWAKDKESICLIMYNPKTKALFYAPKAQKDSVAYGGCHIICLTQAKKQVSPYAMVIQRNSVKTESGPAIVSTISYQSHKMIEIYQSITSNELPCDIEQLGWSKENFEKIPLPSLRDYVSEMMGKSHTGNEYAKLCLNRGNEYTFQNIMDCLCLEKALDYIPDDKKSIYEGFFKDKYLNMIEVSYFTNEPLENSVLFGAAFRILGTPKSEINEFYQTLRNSISGMSQHYIDNYSRDYEDPKLLKNLLGKSKDVDKFLKAFDYQSCLAKNEHEER